MSMATLMTSARAAIGFTFEQADLLSSLRDELADEALRSSIEVSRVRGSP